MTLYPRLVYDVRSIRTPEFLCRPDRYVPNAVHLWSEPQTFGPRPNLPGTRWTNTCRRCGEVGYQ